MSAKALIFHMSIFSIRTFPLVPTFVTLILESGLHFEYLDPVNKIWRVISARALIFHMNIACDKIFVLVLNLLTLTFDHLKKKIDIGYNFWKIRY